MSRVVHFEITAKDPKRCEKFYQDAFGWKMQKWAGPMEYWLVMTGDEKIPGIDGGMGRREEEAGQLVTNTIDVVNLDDAVNRVKKAGGTIVRPRSAVHGVGWLAYFKDTEGTLWGMMQSDESAK